MKTRNYQIGDGYKLAGYAASGILFFDTIFAGLVRVEASDNKTVTVNGQQLTVGSWGCAPGLRLKIAEVV